MTTFFAAFAAFAVASLLMALGVIFSNRSLKGSCGGISGLTDEAGQPLCGMCSNPGEACEANGQSHP